MNRSLFLVLLIAGCGTRSSYVETAPQPVYARARHPSEVEIFTATAPTRPFRELGIIEAQQASGWSVDNSPEIVADLRQTAAKRGCDAVIMTGSADRVVGSMTPTTTSVTTLKGYRATCIVYTSAKRVDAAHRAKSDAGVSRKWSAQAGRWELSMTLTSSQMSLSLFAAPAEPEQITVQLNMRRARTSSTDTAESQHKACELEVVAAGATTVATDRKLEETLTQESIEARLPTQVIEQAIIASDAALKLCTTEIGLSEATRKRLQVFVEALHREAAAPSGTTTKRLEL